MNSKYINTRNKCSMGPSADQRRIEELRDSPGTARDLLLEANAASKPIDAREAQRRARVERLLSGDLRKHLKRASELAFDYAEATAIATRRTRP